MKLRVQVDKKNSTSEGFPISKIVNEDGTALATLDIQSTEFAFPAFPDSIAADFLFIASAVYMSDKLIDRAEAEDGWTRQFEVTIPVSSPTVWQQASCELNECVSFLTGDRWKFEFSQLSRQLFGKSSLARPSTALFKTRSHLPLFRRTRFVLSGSSTGLKQTLTRSFFLAGHHDKQMAGPFGDQKNFAEASRLRTPAVACDIGEGRQ